MRERPLGRDGPQVLFPKHLILEPQEQLLSAVKNQHVADSLTPGVFGTARLCARELMITVENRPSLRTPCQGF
jgi:hypothetical protein